MKVLRSITVLFLFVFFGVGAFFISFFVFPFLKTKCACQKVIYVAWKNFCNLLEFLKIIEINYHAKTPAPKGKIIVSNHPTYIDIVILTALIPNCICMAKKELRNNIFMGNIVKSLNLINDENEARLIEEAKKALDAGFNIIIFPSGTRTKKGEPLILHKGAAQIAIKTGANILPVNISQSYEFLAKGQSVLCAGVSPCKYVITMKDEIEIKAFAPDLSEIKLRNKITEKIKFEIS